MLIPSHSRPRQNGFYIHDDLSSIHRLRRPTCLHRPLTIPGSLLSFSSFPHHLRVTLSCPSTLYLSVSLPFSLLEQSGFLPLTSCSPCRSSYRQLAPHGFVQQGTSFLPSPRTPTVSDLLPSRSVQAKNFAQSSQGEDLIGKFSEFRKGARAPHVFFGLILFL